MQQPRVIQRRSIPWRLAVVIVVAVQGADFVRAKPPPAYDFGGKPVRYLENARVKLGINLQAGGAVTYLEDKKSKSGNMINSSDWGRQIQLSYYSGPVPFIGPNGEKPTPQWEGLGWNPIQAGSVGRVASKTIAFEHGSGFLRVRCIPMQWPHANVPGDCQFEVTYQLVADNAILMKARIINQRLDHTQYPARNQEMPALYTNGPWYRLVAASGDQPFTGGRPTILVGKDDGKGWPWVRFHASEHWAALVNDDDRGVGLFQADTCTMTGGFFGGDELKGKGGPNDSQTGYLAPVANRILDHNIDWTYQTHIIVGSLDEIRAYACKQPRCSLSWRFGSDRLGWSYVNAADAGWPIRGALKISYQKSPRGLMQSDVIFWKAEDAPVMEIEASFRFDNPNQVLQAEVVLLPFGPADRTDFPAWANQDPKQKEMMEKKRGEFPETPAIVIPLDVRGDGVMRTHVVKLSGNPGYRGGMKQLQVRFPPADGTAEVRRIGFVRQGGNAK